MRMHGYDRAELGLVRLADSFSLEPSHCMPAEPAFARGLQQASLITCLSNQPFAAYTQRQDFAAPGGTIFGIAMEFSSICPSAWLSDGQDHPARSSQPCNLYRQ